MEEVIEELREQNEPVPVPLELPDDDQLVEIEEQLLINLPFELREFLLKVSDVVYGRLEPVTATDPQSHTYLPDVAATAWDLGLPRDLVPLCQDGRDYYVVDIEGQVTLWDGDDGELTDETWDSVWHWARDVWLESLSADQCAARTLRMSGFSAAVRACRGSRTGRSACASARG